MSTATLAREARPATSGISRAELEAAIERTPFARGLGARVLEFAEGRVAFSIPCHDALTMHLGFVHGAVVGFMADSACAWAAASVAGDVVTSEYKLNLLAPATGSELVAVGEVVKASSRQVVCRADVFGVVGGDRRIVATALATVARVR